MNMAKQDKQSKRFWKIMPKDSTRNGHQYVTGLNIDPQAKPLSEVGSCAPGAFYFTDDAHVHKFLHYGGYAREVTLPEGEPFKQDKEGDKWKAHRIILGPLITLRGLLKEVPFPEIYNDSLYLLNCNLKGVTLPKKIIGHLYLLNCNLNGVTFTEEVDGYLEFVKCDLRCVTLPKKINACNSLTDKWPEQFRGTMHLRCCDLEGVTWPNEVSGYLYFTGCNFRGVKIPERFKHKVIK